jgi:methylmalonyl-CoA/ethylmalonyl-CoA epimerase
MEKTFINYMYGGAYQMGFVTTDMKRATDFFINTLGVPKFFELYNPEINNQTLHGKPVDLKVNLAFGQWGATNIEIIQPIAGESTYTDMLKKYEWIGLHHVAIKVFDFDKTINDLTAQGFEIAQTGEVGRGTRFHYFDMTKEMNYFLEVIYLDADFEKIFDQIRRGDF